MKANAAKHDEQVPRDLGGGVTRRVLAHNDAMMAVEVSFEDKLKRFMQDSDSKISGLYSDRRVSRRKNRQ